MQDLIMNFQRKHGKKVPLPKLYMDEDTSDSEGLELQDGSVVGKKATGGSSGGGKLGRNHLPVVEAVGELEDWVAAALAVAAVPAQVVAVA